MKKYNIALLPKNKSQEIISITENFSNFAANYVLGQNSLPHVTICHFEAEEEGIDQLWDAVTEKISPNNLVLTFNEFSCISFDNKTYWASLLPDNLEILFGMHEVVSNILGKGIKPNYDPHLTLFDSKDESYFDKVNELKASYISIKDEFQLSVGLSDGVGQYLSVVYREE